MLRLDFLSSVGGAGWLLTHQQLPLGFAAEGAGRILQQFVYLLEQSFFFLNMILFFFFSLLALFFSFHPAHAEKRVSLGLADGTLAILQRAVSWVSSPHSVAACPAVRLTLVCFRNPCTLSFQDLRLL